MGRCVFLLSVDTMKIFTNIHSTLRTKCFLLYLGSGDGGFEDCNCKSFVHTWSVNSVKCLSAVKQLINLKTRHQLRPSFPLHPLYLFFLSYFSYSFFVY